MHTPGTPARMSRGNCSSPQALTSPTPPPPPPSLFCSILSLHLRTSELEQYRPRCPHASNLKIKLTQLISFVVRISYRIWKWSLRITDFSCSKNVVHFFSSSHESIFFHGHLKLLIDICEHKYLIYAIVEKLWQNWWSWLQRRQMCPSRTTLSRWRPPPLLKL